MATPQTVTVKLVNAGNPVVKDSYGVDVGPYTLAVNGVDLLALCVDDQDWSSVGASWTATVTKLSGLNVSNTYNPSELTEYEETAVLYNLITKSGADRVDIQHAAWDIMDGQITNKTALNWAIWGGYISPSDGAIPYIEDAISAYNTTNLNGFEILSDSTAGDCSREQEFLVYTPASTATPEPGTYALLGLGLIALGGSRALYNKRKMAKELGQPALVRKES